LLPVRRPCEKGRFILDTGELMLRNIVIGITTGAVALVIACSSDNTNSSGTSSGGTSASSSGTSGSGTTFKSCNSSGAKVGECTEADLKPYSDCFNTKCESKYKECYGPNYLSGSFSGACGTYITCTQKCDCAASNYASCVQACVQDSACTECAKGFVTCTNGCTLPACATAGTSSGTSGTSGSPSGATCATLQACCDKLAGSAKTGCESAKNAASGSDATWGGIYDALYKAQCP
jgi:hypothetical protein